MNGAGTMFDGVAKLADVFFNGRASDGKPAKGGVTMAELIKRGKSHVVVGGKLYKITVEEAKIAE